MQRIKSVTVGTTKGKHFINVYVDDKRFRFWNGNVIGVTVRADEEPELLRSAFELRLREGWLPERKIKKKELDLKPVSFLEGLESKLKETINGNYSYHHKRDCRWVLRNWERYSSALRLNDATVSDIDSAIIKNFILQPQWSARTQKNVLRTLTFLCKDLKLEDGVLAVRTPRCKAELHKPIPNIHQLLADLKDFDTRLYLTCLMTYGCLLRPHQELRLLKWSDVDIQRSIISLSGKRNKSGRNRIVPIPSYVQTELINIQNEDSYYVISGRETPFSRDYISVLWRRFKRKHPKLQEGVTLYSFRHAGSINVYEKTGSLQKLQQVMGHSTMQVSLTYLRGLEIQQLDVNDLPDL